MPCSERIISVQMTKITVWSLCHHMGRTVRTKEPFLGGPQIPLRWMGIFLGGGHFPAYDREYQACGQYLDVIW